MIGEGFGGRVSGTNGPGSSSIKSCWRGAEMERSPWTRVGLNSLGLGQSLSLSLSGRAMQALANRGSRISAAVD